MKIAEVIVRMLNDRRYKRNKPTCVRIFIDEVSFCQRIFPKDSELVRLTHEIGLFEEIEPIYLIDYDSIVEVLGTASFLGYFIRSFRIESGVLWLELEKNYRIDNINPELIETIASNIEQNWYNHYGKQLDKQLDELK